MKRGSRMDAIARHRLWMKAKKHMSWGGIAIAVLVVVEIAWVWALWRILDVTLSILAWGGEI